MRVRAGRGGIRVEAESVAALRDCVGTPWAVRETRRLAVVVESWRPPRPGWSGGLGPIPGLIRHEIELPRRGSGRVTVQLRLTRPAPLQLLLAAVLDVLRPRRRAPAPVSVDVARYGPNPSWLPPAQNTAGFVGREPDEEKVRPYDVLLVDPDPGAGPLLAAGAVAARVDATGIAIAGRHTILVDDRGVDAGFDPPEPGRRTSDFSLALTGDDPDAQAAALVRLALTGTAPHLKKLPERTAALLADELVAILAEAPPVDDDSSDSLLAWEVRSVRARRAALRNHATALALAPAVGILPPRLPGVTALIVARQPDRVPAALAAVAAQTYPELEVVLGLAGRSMTGPIASAVAACARSVDVRDDVGLDAAVLRARGPLITVIDETANYGPEHIWDLVLAHHSSGAILVGKGAEFTHHAGITVRRRMLLAEAYTARVSPGAMMIARGDLESLGGWHRLPARVKQAGGLTYRTHPLGYVRQGSAPVPVDAAPRWTGLPPYHEFGG